jgi:hypothetical protein
MNTLAALFQIEIEYSDSTRKQYFLRDAKDEYSSIYYKDIYVERTGEDLNRNFPHLVLN